MDCGRRVLADAPVAMMKALWTSLGPGSRSGHEVILEGFTNEATTTWTPESSLDKGTLVRTRPREPEDHSKSMINI